MEITRQPAIGFNLPSEPTASAKTASTSVAPVVPVAAVEKIKPGLEQIQSVLGQLPHVDLEKVALIKAALVADEIASDSASLAAAILTYHRANHR
ncbi:flagellar biosynthesis anti-sigma factor FlgM [Pseudomonas chlororaphis subsp. aurantiaca]|uniref:flagellar biosynthesis anti-sigma factor FlgM n=1 Tax=Pseudomonas chlororaphis TaxID=587753 RepID=UPI0027DE2DFA|nr:flagellar biosynthesis anti-sigma factor FlgM [Pseudomonas chlororaphis]WMI97619.1 flagellar biosynthesis anti-sigma factor FlgM [Pseudomonas chlororaphis subsp. aurantiaca]